MSAEQGKKNMRTGKPYTKLQKIAGTHTAIQNKRVSETMKPDISKFGDEIIHLSSEKANKIELIEDVPESLSYKIKFELMDVGEYNHFDFSLDNLKFMVDAFVSDKVGIVSHGMDHSLRTLEQLGKVYDLKFDDSDGRPKVWAFSELFRGPGATVAQNEAYKLFKQGLLNFVSGGWKPEKVLWNEEKQNLSIVKPMLREISSTPTPAKRDAKAQEILNSLNHAPLELEEESTMEPEQPKDNPPTQGASGEEQKRLSLLEEQVKTLKANEAENAKRIETAARDSLIAKGVELGFTADEFKDMNSTGIADALRLANKAIVVAMGKKDPTTSVGGMNMDTSKDGTAEMADTLLKTHFGHLSRGELPKGAK